MKKNLSKYLSPNIKPKQLRESNVHEIIDDTTDIIKITQSLCPECAEEGKYSRMKLLAVVYRDADNVMIKKKCPKHGIFDELYWGDYDMYRRAERFQDKGIKIETPGVRVSESEHNCPLDCGLCPYHKSQTALANIVVTNRCDLNCWYCFFYAKKGQAIYEPTLEQIRKMLRELKNQKPVGCNAVQFTGGEPAVREDIIAILKIAKEEGYDHIQFNTNGIEMYRNPTFVKSLVAADVNTVYLSFDGVSPESNPKNYWEIPGILDNMRASVSASPRGLPLMATLVPTVINGVNDHELWDIIRFAGKNVDVVRAINFQPISIVGRTPRAKRRQMRITIPDAIKKIEIQSKGKIRKEDFFPIPCVRSVSDFMDELSGRQRYRFSNHFACGKATYLFRDKNGELIPLPQFFDVEGFFAYLDTLTNEMRGRGNTAKAKATAKLLVKIKSFVDEEKVPEGLKIGKMLYDAMVKGDYDGLREFHHKSIFVGMMHFMDLYNYDVDRVERCNIHYAMPDGRRVPFCAFNVLPSLYRDKVQAKFATPWAEWHKKNPDKKIEFYKRSLTAKDKKKVRGYYQRSLAE
ncbi:MAG: tetraether lipid synthase Tes [archaeon]